MRRIANRSILGPALIAAVLLFVAHLAPAAEKNDTSIERMKKDIFFLAGDECEGRGVETKGINKAADHIAATFKELGLKPAMANDSYFQPFTIKGRSKLGAPNKFTVNGPLGQEILVQSPKQYNVSGSTGKGKASGDLAFAGYGITTPTYDDYKGLDVKGKIVIVFRQTPRAKNKLVPFPDSDRHAPLINKIENAQEHKAVGILFVNDRAMAAEDDPLPNFDYSAGQGGGSIPAFHVRRALIDQLLASSLKNLNDLETDIDRELKPRSFELKGTSATMEATIERPEIIAKNVIGILEGKGPLAN